MTTSLPNVAVIGAGTMGHGIAYVAALAGCRVAITDADAGQLARACGQIERAFGKAIERAKCTPAQRDAALARLTAAPTVDECVTDANLVIEAIPEQLAMKQRLFADVEQVVHRDTVLASNTSSLSITEIGRPLRHPERMLGMHFFNPVPAMALIEIVRGEATAAEAIDRARAFARLVGKEAIVVRDSPGFATSRLGVVLGLEAIRMVEQGVATAEDIDQAMVLGYRHPVGPLRLTDMVGLDVRLANADHLHATLREATYRAPALLRQKVARGELGKKSGQGFYRWENER
jgi:3-hydroxybutyryl-CoA dehydrogenase